jgi:AraC-like DNA-binding protein
MGSFPPGFALPSRSLAVDVPPLLTGVLRVAEKMLCSPGSYCSIAEIASESGFADQAHFGRSFRRAFGKTPQQFRRDREWSETAPGLWRVGA